MAWYEDLYNKTIGSIFCQGTLRQPLKKVFGDITAFFIYPVITYFFSTGTGDETLYFCSIDRREMMRGCLIKRCANGSFF